VCANVPRLIDPQRTGCSLVIDWLDVREYRYSEETPEPTETVLSGEVYGNMPVGEADIKFAY
jgi:hypothetical protein